MVTYAYEDLGSKTVAQLRELAKELKHEALHGYSTMHKKDLVLALCTALGIEAREHHEVVGVDKSALKGQIRELKTKRTAALEGHDRKGLKAIRRQIRSLKRQIRKAKV